MDLSLRDLAKCLGVSAPMSQVERGGSPTLQIAKRIELALSCGLRSCSGSTRTARSASCTAGERRKGPSAVEGHGYEILTPPLPRPTRRAVAPYARARRGHGRAPPCTSPAVGRRRWSSGAKFRFAMQQYELLDGDCVTFDADLNHHFENPGPEEAVLLAVLSAGLRRS